MCRYPFSLRFWPFAGERIFVAVLLALYLPPLVGAGAESKALGDTLAIRGGTPAVRADPRILRDDLAALLAAWQAEADEVIIGSWILHRHGETFAELQSLPDPLSCLVEVFIHSQILDSVVSNMLAMD